MGPLPPIYDPARAVDKLPQPYRMIDKLVAEIIEKALGACITKDELKKLERATNIGMRFAPHAILAADGGATCFTTPGIAGLVVVGTAKGEIIALTARDTTAMGKDQAHESAVTAMDSGNVAATGAKLVASASQGHLVVHDVMIKTADLVHLAKIALPEDPDDPQDHVPAKLTFSANASHLAICYHSGALAVYELELPTSYYAAAKPDSSAPAPQAAEARTGKLQLVLQMTVATVKGLLIGSPQIGASSIEWRQQQRPDKSGKSDRFHKPARGVYIWWKGCNRIAMSYLTASDPASTSATPAAPSPEPSTAAASKTPASKPSTPLSSKGGRPGAAAPPGPASPGPREAPPPGVRSRPNKTWMLPHGVTCSCISQDGTMLAFGMTDGSVVVWDDHFGSHIRILPRMPTSVSAMAFVNGLASRIFCTSSCGTVYVADFARPEDSYTAKVKLPQTANQVCFLPSDPFAICMCPGTTEPAAKSPRLVWYDMSQQKFVAECVGKSAELNFGMACTYQPKGKSGADGAGAGPGPVMSFPRWNIKESYFIAGGPLQRSTTFRPPNGVLPEEVPDEEWPRESVLLLYKIDALARYLMPEENQSKASKSLLERMLADLHAPKNRFGKHVKYDQPDPDAPKPPPSALRRGAAASDASEDDDDSKSGGRRHIAFEDADLFDDAARLDKKQFKKETRSGGYSEGQKKPEDPNALPDPSQMNRPGAPPIASFATERPASPPWHHTNPLARIHPDWEEAPVLARIMDRIGSKGGGRKKRDRRLITVAAEMGSKLGKEAGPKPMLLTK